MPAEKDLYVQENAQRNQKRAVRVLPRPALIAGIIEARGCERFGMVAESLPPGPLQEFYRGLTRAESQHGALFYRLARTYFDDSEAAERQEELFVRESEIVQAIPIRPVVH